MESDSTNAIAWASNQKINPWKIQFIFNEIRVLVASITIIFHHELRSANSIADVLARQGVDRASLSEGFIV